MFTLLAVLTACGGGGRPSEDDIAKALKDKDNPAGRGVRRDPAGRATTIIDCIAKALHDSDLSDDALQAIVDGDEDFKGSKGDDDRRARTRTSRPTSPKCITG